MTSAFSTNDTECLNRDIEHSIHDAANFEQIWDKQRLNDCLQFVDSYEFSKVSITNRFCYSISISPFNFFQTNQNRMLLVSNKNICGKICLQFSDDLIPFSAAILDDLKKGITSTVQLCILGDTSYGSCCVDEVSTYLNE